MIEKFIVNGNVLVSFRDTFSNLVVWYDEPQVPLEGTTLTRCGTLSNMPVYMDYSLSCSDLRVFTTSPTHKRRHLFTAVMKDGVDRLDVQHFVDSWARCKLADERREKIDTLLT